MASSGRSLSREQLTQSGPALKTWSMVPINSSACITQHRTASASASVSGPRKVRRLPLSSLCFQGAGMLPVCGPVRGTLRCLSSGADGGGRTRTGKARGILSPLRLPVSPRPRYTGL